MYPTSTNGSVLQRDYNNPAAPVYFISASAGNVEGLTPGNITQPYSALVDSTHFGQKRHSPASSTEHCHCCHLCC